MSDEFRVESDGQTVEVYSSTWGLIAKLGRDSGGVMERTRIGGYATSREKLYVMVDCRYETFSDWGHRVHLHWAVHVEAHHCPGWDVCKSPSFKRGSVEGPTLKTSLGSMLKGKLLCRKT